MFEQIKNRILTPNKVAAIELTFVSEGGYIINCLVVERKKGIAVITGTYYNLKDLKDLDGKIPEFTPTALVLNGKGLIHKTVSNPSNSLPPEILPGANPNDFLFQYFSLLVASDIAIVRKSHAEKLIEELGKLNIPVTSLSLAFYDIGFIADHINHTGEIFTTQYKLNFSTNRILHYQVNSQEEKEVLVKPEINVGTEYVKSNFLIPYSAALKLMTTGYNLSGSIQLNSVLENQKRLSQRLLLKTYSLTFLAGLFLLLLANFLIYSNYFSKNNELVSKYQLSLIQTERLDSLKKGLDEKKDFLTVAGWLNDSKTISYYADRIAATVPDSVILTSLVINPAVLIFSNGTKQWKFQQDTILLAGNCNDPSLLDDWMKQVLKIENIKQSKIKSYTLRKQGEAGFFTAEALLK